MTPTRTVKSSRGGQIDRWGEPRLGTGAECENKDTGLAPFPGSGAAPECRQSRLVQFPARRPRPLTSDAALGTWKVMSSVSSCVGRTPPGAKAPRAALHGRAGRLTVSGSEKVGTLEEHRSLHPSSSLG